MCISRNHIASILLKSNSGPNFSLDISASDQLVKQYKSEVYKMSLILALI